jgi:PAS domain S-box-containing protein
MENEHELAIVEASNDAIVSKDLDGTITRWNAAAERLFGYRAHEALGRSILLLVPPDNRDEIAEALERVRKGEHVNYPKTVRLTKDGRRIAVSVRISPVLDDDGKIVGASTIARDLSGLRQAEAKFRTLVEQLPIAVYIDALDATSSNLYSSPHIEEMLGYSVEDWRSDPDLFRRILHSEDRERVLGGHANAYKTGEPLCMEYRLLARDGRVVWIRDEGVLVQDESGNPASLQGYLLDITEQKRAENELQDAEEKFRTLAEQLPLVTYRDGLTPDGPPLYVSPQIEDLTGFSPEEWTGDPDFLWKVMHPDDRERVRAETDRASEEGHLKTEYRMIRRGGEVVWVRDVTITIEDDQGQPLYLQGFFLDITEQKHAEAELRAAEEKYRLLAENLPLVTYIARREPDNRSLYISPQIEELTGYPVEKWVARSGFFSSVVHPDDRVGLRDIRRDADGRFSQEYRLIARDGRVLWVRDESVRIGERAGESYFVQGFLVDITAQKQAEFELREAERKYRSLVEHLPLATFQAPLDSLGPLLYASPQLEQMLGYSRDEWLTEPHLPFAVVHPDDHDRWAAELAHAKAKQEPFESEFRVVAKDGHVIWVEDATVVVLGEDGVPAYRQGYLRDITARKESERRLALQLAIASVLAESPPVEEALSQVLAEIGRAFEWECGAFWTVDSSKRELGCIAQWHAHGFEAASFERISRTTRLSAGEGLPGRVWSTASPVWISNFPRADPPRSSAAKEAGLRTGIGCPLTVGKKVLGVLELLSKQEIEERQPLVQMLSVVGSQIGQFLERSRAQSDLRSREAQLAEAQRIAHLGSFEWDVASDRLAVSEELLAILGFEKGRFKGRYADFIDRVHPEDRERIDSLVQHSIATGESSSSDYRVVLPSGEIRHLRAERVAELDESGNVIRLTGTAQDVTGRVEAEAQLRESEERFRAVFDSAAVGIHVLDPQGRITTCNRAFASMLGYEPAELAGVEILALTHLEDQDGSEQLSEQVLAGTVEYARLEKRYLAKDGSSVWVNVIVVPIGEPGDEARYRIGLVDDLRERRQLEEDLRHAQKMEAVGRLAGGVAHDFNNLLLAIRGYSELALTELDETADAARTDIEQIKEATERAASLTGQLLAFSRKQILHPRPVDLSELVAEWTDLLRRVVGEGVELETNLDLSPTPVRLDPLQMEQALLNLVINACDAMGDEGRLTIGTANLVWDGSSAEGMSIPPGQYVKLSVSDTGSGMDDATKQRVFEPFFTTKSSGGTGLGLSTAYGFVEQSGGHMLVESAPGKGATFELYFPLADDLVTPKPERPAQPDTAGVETILLVEERKSSVASSAPL